MKRTTLALLTSLIIPFLGIGCASTGTNFNEAQIPEIKKGVTTEPDLIAMFENPRHREYNSEGEATFKWIYAESLVKGESFIPYAGAFMGGSDSAQKHLFVTLGPDGKVTSFSSSVGAMESRSNRVQEVPPSA